MTQELLAIVPVRAGSKGVPRKNVALLAGRPMFAHTVEAIRQSGIATRIVVSTDDPEIQQWCELHGVEVHRRSPESAADDATIAFAVSSVVHDLDWQDDIAVFQATSPLRSAQSIRQAWDYFQQTGADSLMSCVRVPHLHWRMQQGKAVPLFSKRANRQALDGGNDYLLSETGSIQFARAQALTPESLVGKNHVLYELPREEAHDIDDFSDLEVVRRHFHRLLVVFRFTANARVGSGHLHHVLQISELFPREEVAFLLKDCDDFAVDAIVRAGHRYVIEHDLQVDLTGLAGDRSVVVVNDVLDTQEADLLVQRAAGCKVVCIEDLGAGLRFADLVVNALYAPPSTDTHRVRTGPRWATLRTEFFDLPPKTLREQATSVLVTFGGTDPGRLTQRFVPSIVELGYHVTVVVGAGNRSELQNLGNARVVRDLKSMAGEMLAADVVLTSAGRTVYEAAATGTPTLVLAQNAREATHAHLGYESGALFLGLGVLNEPDHVAATVDSLMRDADLRRELSNRLRRGLDGLGAVRIAQEIKLLGEGLG